MVLRELVTACRLAESPTRRSPVLVNATTEGVVRLPSEFSRTSGSPPSMTAMQELVVPKSMPITFAIKLLLMVYLTTFLKHWRCHKYGQMCSCLVINWLHYFCHDFRSFKSVPCET